MQLPAQLDIGVCILAHFRMDAPKQAVIANILFGLVQRWRVLLGKIVPELGRGRRGGERGGASGESLFINCISGCPASSGAAGCSLLH